MPLLTPGNGSIPIFCDLTLPRFLDDYCFCFLKGPTPSGLAADCQAAVFADVTRLCPSVRGHNLQPPFLLVRRGSASSFSLTESMWSLVCVLMHTSSTPVNSGRHFTASCSSPWTPPWSYRFGILLVSNCVMFQAACSFCSWLHFVNGDMKTVIPAGDSTRHMWKYFFLSFPGLLVLLSVT